PRLRRCRKLLPFFRRERAAVLAAIALLKGFDGGYGAVTKFAIGDPVVVAGPDEVRLNRHAVRKRHRAVDAAEGTGGRPLSGRRARLRLVGGRRFCRLWLVCARCHLRSAEHRRNAEGEKRGANRPHSVPPAMSRAGSLSQPRGAQQPVIIVMRLTSGALAPLI